MAALALCAQPLRAGDLDLFGWDAGPGDAELRDGDLDDPMDYASETDIEFEQDEVLAINLSPIGAAAARALGFVPLETLALPSLRFSVTPLRLPEGFRARKALAALRKADPEGSYGDNPVYRLAGAESPAAADACAGLRCYGRQLVNWPSDCRAQARIGMLDSAIDARHAAFAGRQLYRTRISTTPVSRLEQDHGTAVAALLVGDAASGYPGLLPESKLFAADVFALDRRARPYTDALLLAQGLDWLAHQQLQVLNLSITGPDSPVLHAAIRQIAARGVLMAAAAGNEGARAAPQYPAAYPEVLAVTAVDRQMKIYGDANRGDYIQLSAPGVSIWTAGIDAGAFRDGTSFAAPLASAALALTRSVEPLLRRARDLGATGRDPVFGAGLLQAPACTMPQAAASRPAKPRKKHQPPPS